jgi:hypothetical protein
VETGDVNGLVVIVRVRAPDQFLANPDRQIEEATDFRQREGPTGRIRIGEQGEQTRHHERVFGLGDKQVVQDGLKRLVTFSLAAALPE